MNSRFAWLCRALAMGLALGAPQAVAADAPPSYAISTVVNLGAPDRWDYLSFDQHARRVYVSHGDEVTVVDGLAGKIVGQITGLPGSHGTAVADALNRGASDSAQNKNVVIFDATTLKPVGTAPTGDDADGVAYDRLTHRAFIANGDAQALTAVDLSTGQTVGTVPLAANPEFLITDNQGHVFVNGENTREILRVDAKTLQVTSRFPIPDCERPHGIDMDTETDRIFSSCSNAKLFVVDAKSGRIVASFDIGKFSDAVRFDPKRKLVLSSNGEGNLSVIAEKSADEFQFLGNVPTVRGARTMALDAETGRVFLATADVDHIDPPKESGGRPHVVYKPGTLKLYFLDPVH